MAFELSEFESDRRQTGRETDGTVVHLTVNGDAHSVAVRPNVTLLEVLRDHLGLTGTKRGCDFGDCGTCTVLLDGEAVKSCLVLAVAADGREVTTIEGLERTARCTRCRRRSSPTARSSAATAPRAW